MAETEDMLLQRFVNGGDAGAFAEIVRRHAGPVYGTCLRVLADADKAADATQETFYQLVRRGHEVRESLGGWLHRVAVRKAVDRIRVDSARRRSEERHLEERTAEPCTWSEVSPYVDEALDSLDDATRVFLVRHYLEGCSMTELAGESGVSRPTISRRLDAGLAQVRAHLHRRGVWVTVGTLSALLAENAAQSAPAGVLQQAGKMILVHAGAPGIAGSLALPKGIMTGSMAAVAHTKLVTVVAVAVLIGAGAVAYRTFSSDPPAAPVPHSSVSYGSGGAHVGRTGSQPQEASLPVKAEDATPGPESNRETVVEGSRLPAASVRPEEPVESTSEAPESPTAARADFRLDLSSPESTVRSFTKAWVCGDPESILACWLPTAGDYEDIRRGAYADPNDPQQRAYYEGKLVFQSLDPDAEMPIVATKENDDGGTSVTWRVTFKKDATMNGQILHAGDTQDIEATVRKCGDSWLIDNM